MHIEFHPEACKRFEEIAGQLQRSIRRFNPRQPRTPGVSEIHPAFTITSEHVIGKIEVVGSVVHGSGKESGRTWISGEHRVGWQGAEFQLLRELATSFARTKALRGAVSITFLIDEVFHWLQEALEGKSTEPIYKYVADRCAAEIRDYEIWIPLHRTYSRREFSIGDVRFRTLSKELMGHWAERVGADPDAQDPVVRNRLNRQRSELQAGLAACISVRAERRKAIEIAHSKAEIATSLLRFLSPANLTSELVCYCVPLGRERRETATEILMSHGKIEQIGERVIDRGPSGWNVDQARALMPGFLEALHNLASNTTTDFRRAVFDAMLVYSRNSVSSETSDKLVFVLAALESILLRSSSEPIQKNLGERMAFLIGQSLPERKAILKNVEDTYRVRSGFIHHGNAVEDTEVVNKFLVYAWTSFANLLGAIDKYKSTAELTSALEDRKMS